jgi:hypothetical protein
MQLARTSSSLRSWLALSSIVSLALTGCLGDADKPGLGYSEANPTGTPFVLPAGLELAAAPRGYAYLDDEHCPDFDEVEIHGSGGLVTLCLPLRNTTARPIELVLPPGLIFVSESLDLQNGLLTERVTVSIPAGATTGIVVASYCTNASRGTPDAEDEYAIGPITDDPDLRELIAILDGLDLPGRVDEASEEQLAAINTLQSAVWEITEMGALTDATRAQVEAMVD